MRDKRDKRDKPVVLITGFGPFPKVPENVSALLVEELRDAATAALPSIDLVAAVLPSQWSAAPQALDALLTRHDPDIALHFGVSDKARGFVLETVARNVTCATADAAGAMAPQTCLIEQASNEMRVTLDADVLAMRLRARGVAAVVSKDAGAYICNAALFHSLLHAHARDPKMLAGFIHIPERLAPPSSGSMTAVATRSAAARRKACVSDLDWAGAVAGGIAIISHCLEQLHSAPSSRTNEQSEC